VMDLLVFFLRHMRMPKTQKQHKTLYYNETKGPTYASLGACLNMQYSMLITYVLSH